MLLKEANVNNITFISPVYYLTFAKRYTPQELRIGRVTFVSRERLPLIRRRLGIQTRLSEMASKDKLDPQFLKHSPTYGIIQLDHADDKTNRECFDLLTEALHILAVSLLGWSKRRYHSLPAAFGFPSVGKFEYLLVHNALPRQYPSWSILGIPSPMVLNPEWKAYHREGFFFRLLRIINNDIHLPSKWRTTIVNAAVLAGQSQTSKSLIQAFLWNMIVLEMLLSRQGEKYVISLPKRIESFIGWVGYWRSEAYQSRIESLYKKRKALVHDGDFSQIEIADLLFADELVLNVFDNIINHIHLFRNKEDVLRFSDKVEAERVLGIRSKTQPKTLRSIRRQYDDADLREMF
jgi:hypothetical protein